MLAKVAHLFVPISYYYNYDGKTTQNIPRSMHIQDEGGRGGGGGGGVIAISACFSPSGTSICSYLPQKGIQEV